MFDKFSPTMDFRGVVTLQILLRGARAVIAPSEALTKNAVCD
jgi:hypothetical protein